MFTGIIETMGLVKEVTSNQTNKSFWIESPFISELKIDQSVAHNGICLTIEDLKDNTHKVTAVQETLEKTDITLWNTNSYVNLERSLLPTSRIDGHLVQGHIDGIGICTEIKNLQGSWQMEFQFDKQFAPYIIEKGSICINGVSLTAFDVRKKSFKVAIIPYTFEHTCLKFLKEKGVVNLEFDLIGKYINRKLSLER